MSIAMARKKIKLDKEAISEILVADTDSESGFEASNFEDYFEKEEEEDHHHLHHHHHHQQKQASAEIETQAATSGGLPAWGPRQGRNTNIHPLVCPAKGVKKSEAPHINKDSSPLSVLMLFSQKVFICWLNRPTCTTSNTQTDKPDLAADCLTLRCRT